MFTSHFSSLSNVYLFQWWWSSCQTCSCLMMMGTFSIKPAANRKLEGQREGFIWDGRPSCYHLANRNGSAASGVLPPDNVSRQQLSSYSTLRMNGNGPDKWFDCPSPPKKLFFPHNIGMVPHSWSFFTRCPCRSRMGMKPFHVAVWNGPNTCCRVAPTFLFICLQMKACLWLCCI